MREWRHHRNVLDHRRMVQRRNSAATKRRRQARLIETEEGLFEVKSSGMLRKVEEEDTKWNHTHHPKKNMASGYAPRGGPLPKAPNTAVFAKHAVSWDPVDNFTCLTSHNNHHPHNHHHPYYDWQTRAPYVILLGAMKSGTQALTHYLWQHPLFLRKHKGMEIHFFNNHDYMATPKGIPVLDNQKRYAQRFQKSHANFFTDPLGTRSVARPTGLLLDSTPYYLLGTDRIPQAIACVAPWAKLLAILRNPVDRAASHYRYLHQARFEHHKPMVDWEVWVDHDIRMLRDAGVLRNTNHDDHIESNNENDDSFAGSHEEYQAWVRYLRNATHSQQIVGRGLYAIQITHYLQVLQKMHHSNDNDHDTSVQYHNNSSSQLLVIPSEELRTHTQEVYDRVCHFLGVPLHTLNDTAPHHETTHNTGVPMPAHVRATLVKIFRPYNARLFRLLGWDAATIGWDE